MTQSQCPGCTVKMGLQSAVREVYVHGQQALMIEIAGLARALHKPLPPKNSLKEFKKFKKITILSSFPPSCHSEPAYIFFSSVKCKMRYLADCPICSFPLWK